MKRARILSLSLMLSMLTGFSASAAKVLDIKSGLTVENSVTTEPSISVSESESEISNTQSDIWILVTNLNTGQEVAKAQCTSDLSIKFDTTSWPSGIYVVSMVSGDKVIDSQKVQI